MNGFSRYFEHVFSHQQQCVNAEEAQQWSLAPGDTVAQNKHILDLIHVSSLTGRMTIAT
jgi:hypothetical protein